MLVTNMHMPMNKLVSVVSVSCFVAAASIQDGNMSNKVNVWKPSDMQSQIALVSRQEAFTMICEITGLA